MLILSRKPGEALDINGKIEIKIIEINGDKVKIGINAPDDVKILRSELCQTMESNKDAASSVNPKKLLSMLSDMEEKNQ
ncbi:MAG: carbon storage regulator CsrA [Oscillospiraceae bacterium]|nr:carbon storage regulator CsrA [Oscillospiraceae bacterium]